MNGLAGPSGAVLPGTRPDIGYGGVPAPSGGFWNPYGNFQVSDLYACYPLRRWVAERLQEYPQEPVGNALRDPLGVPFTAQAVRGALLDVYRNRKMAQDRNCAPVSPDSVRIALEVLPILESRNGGWIDFNAGRRPEPGYLNRPPPNRVGVFHLKCLLYRLVGKPLPKLYQGFCTASQPRRLEAIYNIRDVRTTFIQVPGAFPEELFPPYPVDHPSMRPWPELPVAEEEPEPEPEPFAYPLFEIFETFDFRKD